LARDKANGDSHIFGLSLKGADVEEQPFLWAGIAERTLAEGRLLGGVPRGGSVKVLSRKRRELDVDVVAARAVVVALPIASTSTTCSAEETLN
jgi:hypothetical protein